MAKVPLVGAGLSRELGCVGASQFLVPRRLEGIGADLGVSGFPPSDFTDDVGVDGRRMSFERAIRHRLQQTFYMVGPALAPYMICDWQLWLWSRGLTAVFATFKLDSFHEQFVAKYGRGVVPETEDAFIDWWFGLYPDLPPRLVNECVWLGIENGLV